MIWLAFLAYCFLQKIHTSKQNPKDNTMHTNPKTTQAVKQKILDAVHKLLLTQGIHSISVQKVADMAGISKGGLFYHFASKDALLNAFFGATLAQISQKIQSYQNGFEPKDWLMAYALTVFDDLENGCNHALIVLQFLSAVGYQNQWQDWLYQNKPTLDTMRLQSIFYTLDGIWLNAATRPITGEELQALKAWVIKRIEKTN